MRLSTFITVHIEDILEEFEHYARTRTASGETMDKAALRDHAASMVEVIVHEMERPLSPAARERKAKGDEDLEPRGLPGTPAERHGIERATSDFSLEETFGEFRALRASVLRLWSETDAPSASEASLQEVIRFNEAIDQALAESLARYARQYQREYKERAVEAEAQRRIAERADRVKSDFLRMMSHELRTPLNAIRGYTGVLDMGIHGPLTSGQQDTVVRIRESERHLLSVIDGILDFQRIGVGKATYHVEEITVGTALAALPSMIEPMAQTYGVEFAVDGEWGDERVLADEAKLRQVLLNLLSNAVRFTPRGGRVWLECQTMEEEICLHVHDTGKGIPSEKLDIIFDPFVQVHAGVTTREHGGSGLGLTISRNLLHGMGGRLTVTSELGVGSTFSVYLPRARPIDETGDTEAQVSP